MADNVPEAPKTTHLLEFKTMNDKSFKKTKKEGIKASKPVYYAQVQLYMGGLGLKRCLHINVNKNDDEWYVERIKFDKQEYERLLDKGADILAATHPPMRKFKSSWYECKWCDARNLCHNNSRANINCRTCTHSQVAPKGEWYCSLHDKILLVEWQRTGCRDHSPIDMG